MVFFSNQWQLYQDAPSPLARSDFLLVGVLRLPHSCRSMSIVETYPFDVNRAEVAADFGTRASFFARGILRAVPPRHPFEAACALARRSFYKILCDVPVSLRRGAHVGHPEGYTATISWRVQAARGSMCCKNPYGLGRRWVCRRSSKPNQDRAAFPLKTNRREHFDVKRQIQSLGFS